MNAMRCPSCQAEDDLDPWKAYPAKVLADLSKFIDCSTLFTAPGIYLCKSCGKYFQVRETTLEAAAVNACDLPSLLRPGLCEGFSPVLAFTPDLIRVVTNEIALGNETDSVIQPEPGVTALAMRYYFLDGHMVSSWVDYERSKGESPWLARYFSPTTGEAVVCPSRHLKQDGLNPP